MEEDYEFIVLDDDEETDEADEAEEQNDFSQIPQIFITTNPEPAPKECPRRKRKRKSPIRCRPLFGHKLPKAIEVHDKGSLEDEQEPEITKREEPEEKQIEEEPPPDWYLFNPNFRLVDLNLMAKKLWCEPCSEPLSLRNCVEDKQRLYNSEIRVKCHKCSEIIEFPLTWLTPTGSLAAYRKPGNMSNTSQRNRKLVTKCTELNEALGYKFVEEQQQTADKSSSVSEDSEVLLDFGDNCVDGGDQVSGVDGQGC